MFNSKPKQNIPLSISYPKIVGFMSVDVRREYIGDLSQLKYLNRVAKGRIYLNLSHKIDEAIKRTTDDNDEKINLLLKFLVDRIKDIPHHSNHFITYRRTLISIMCNAYHTDHVRIMACLYNGSIYLCSLDTSKQIQRRRNRTKQEQLFCAWGYKFEQYLLSDLPGILPDFDRPVIENEEFSLYYQSSIGKHQLLYGAQIDGLLATDKVPPPPDTNDFQTNLNYLRSNQYIELKTNREILTQNQEHIFKTYKMLRCWCQCYLAGLKGLLVGFRDDKGIVRRLQCYNTDDIAAYCENEWQPSKALKYLDDFLTFIETSFKNKLEETKSNDQEPLHLQFDDYGNNSITVSECYDKSNVIIPNWYLDKCK